MKTQAYVLISALALFATAPVYAQDHGNHYGRGHGKGNPHSDKQGHNENGSDKHGDRDGDHDRDDHDFSVMRTRLGDAVAQLSIGSLATAEGVPIPIGAQGKLYVVLTNPIVSADSPPAVGTLASNTATATVDAQDASAPSISRFVLALSGAGTAAQSKLATLTRSLTGLANDPARVPRAVSDFNAFVQSASPEFLANPPADFVALHTVLQKLTAGFPQK